MTEAADPPEPTGPVTDDRLRLVFACCHPALSVEARVALTLRLVAGLEVGDIARAFLVAEPTMAQRLTRANRMIRDARIPYRVPTAEDLAPQLSAVLAVEYLVFNEGYLPGSGPDPVGAELCAEAIRLSRLLRGLLPDQPEVDGLLALLLLVEARRPARVADGVLVPLGQQDRGRWEPALVGEGQALVRAGQRRVSDMGSGPGQYQLLAAINAVHTDAAAAADTDWAQIAVLYDHLYAVAPTPLVALNRAADRTGFPGRSVDRGNPGNLGPL